jgi:glycosyltransferase involved in cell wall biosynthesis
MSNKTIVMIGNTSWGMFHFRAETIKEFIRLGHKVSVIAPIDEFSEAIKKLNADFYHIDLNRKGTNPVTELKSIYDLIQLLFKLKPDIVINYTIKPVLYGTFAAKIAGTKKIIAITTGLGFVFSHNNLTSKIAKLLYKYVLKFADEVWFLNLDDEDTFLRSNLITKKKTFILPGEGVNVDYYKPGTKKTAYMTFTLISRMLWDKGVGLFAEAAKIIKQKYPKAQFQIVGPVDEGNPEGISLKQLQDWHNEGFVQYMGPSKDIRPILENTSCLVHPTFYKEGLPRILIEACSMGLPCITTNAPGCRDVIKNNENGFLIEPKNLDSLVKAIEDFLIMDETKKLNLIQNSRDFIIIKFSITKINQIYVSRLGLQ